jgi:hypothetical protein
MPIAVVVTRDDAGAPTTREIYARGERYRIGDGNLQILTADSRVLALYGSGNWLCAYVAGTVAVTSMGKDCSLGLGSPEENRAAAPDAAEAGEFTAGDLVADLPTADLPTGDEPTADALGGGARVVASAPAPRPAEPTDPAPGVARDRAPAHSDPDSARPSWMQPVVFRPRKLAPSRPPEEQPAPSGMRTVAFRPKTFTRNDVSEPLASAGESGPRPVVFRRRTYRAVLIETEPAPADAGPQADD